MYDIKKHNQSSAPRLREAVSDQRETEGRESWRRYVEEPLLRFREVLKLTKVGRSKAFDMMNKKSSGYDPYFPEGFPLFDSPRSPKAWYRDEVFAWIEARAKKRELKEGAIA